MTSEAMSEAEGNLERIRERQELTEENTLSELRRLSAEALHEACEEELAVLRERTEHMKEALELNEALWRALHEAASSLWAGGAVKEHALINAERCKRVLESSTEAKEDV